MYAISGAAQQNLKKYQLVFFPEEFMFRLFLLDVFYISDFVHLFIYLFFNNLVLFVEVYATYVMYMLVIDRISNNL